MTSAPSGSERQPAPPQGRGFPPARHRAGKPASALTLPVVGLVVLLAGGAGCGRERVPASVAPAPPAPAEVHALPATLYFPGEGGRLRAEERELTASPRAEDRVKSVVDALLAGPQGEGLARPLAEGVATGSVYLSAEGVAFVDLQAPEVELPLALGSTAERLTVWSLVNSVAASVPEARRVVLMWNGTQPATLAGHLDLTHPLAPDPGLVER